MKGGAKTGPIHEGDDAASTVLNKCIMFIFNENNVGIFPVELILYPDANPFNSPVSTFIVFCTPISSTIAL